MTTKNSKLGLSIDYSGPVRGIELELEYDDKMVNIFSTSLSMTQNDVLVTNKKENGRVKDFSCKLAFWIY